MLTIQNAIKAFKRATGIEPDSVRTCENWQYVQGAASIGFEAYRGLCEPSDVLDAIKQQRQRNAAGASWWKPETDSQLLEANL